MTKIFIANDHAGFEFKNEILKILEILEMDIVDLGTNSSSSVDYPDFANILCKEVLNNQKSYGILICGSGIGMSIAANRHNGIRAALCNESLSAKLARKHNDANVLCLGARLIGLEMAREIIVAFLCTSFDGERHLRRIEKLK
ncbi:MULTISPECIES: ribose 5-phosphate isomerase B [Helicobacter]|uniref:Ribose 5-phosphate isomerase B n=1 Tax=Helicobacter ibis TaxID=2962633 RepID=A0ABT4VC19_9HELI|nr:MULTISPECIES: ribose 5-phosphate isomerase B [Helicobacter]MDA3967024.1 ribose 5-phosphate isomerase B [Helicobacter sp. WB40]MDA3968249.1 ribose 5-phosphate isomerase B [Helicobacter ibis]